MEIRNATVNDYEEILRIYETARVFMKNTGNPNQWKNTHPSPETVKADIED